ncbi:MAG: RNA polymerase sigma factor [Bdellovibrionales bacterium]|nr:RNA polymerase sigma factor [Bdellovibrionales bacterium]
MIAKAQGGDQQAYAELLELLYPYIQSVVRSKLGGMADSEDLTQECLIGIHKNLSTFQKDRPLKPWISAIIRYKAADYFRTRSKRNEQSLDDLVTNEELSTNSSTEPSAQDVRTLLQALPDKLERALVLTQLEGLSYEEAAKKEGITEPALRKRISRGYLELRKVVKHRFDIEWK